MSDSTATSGSSSYGQGGIKAHFILVVMFMSGGFVGVWTKFQTKFARRSERKKTGDAPPQGQVEMPPLASGPK